MIDAELLARYGPRMLDGLTVTLALVAASMILGAGLGFGVAAARRAERRWIAWPAFAYVTAMRGTPLLAQLFLLYYGSGAFRPQLEAIGVWPLFADPWTCALLAFTLNTAAYQGEIYRGAIGAVPAGQREAAAALGLSRVQAFRLIVLPQALAVAVRPLGNETILMIKASAIAALVTVQDLMAATRLGFSRSFDFQVFLWAAVLYLVLVEIVRRLVDRAEARLTRGRIR